AWESPRRQRCRPCRRISCSSKRRCLRASVTKITVSASVRRCGQVAASSCAAWLLLPDFPEPRRPQNNQSRIFLGSRDVKVLKSIATLFAAGALVATAATGAFAQDKGQIGIAMPTQSSLRWISDGNELKTALEGM